MGVVIRGGVRTVGRSIAVKYFIFSLQVEETGSSTSLTSKENRESRMLMKRILVKCADISNPCRQRRLCKIWADRIANEYFAQVRPSHAHPVVLAMLLPSPPLATPLWPLPFHI